MKQIGFFGEKNRLKELSEIGDPLEKLNRAADWDIARLFNLSE
jgi:hypothetical protein